MPHVPPGSDSSRRSSPFPRSAVRPHPAPAEVRDEAARATRNDRPICAGPNRACNLNMPPTICLGVEPCRPMAMSDQLSRVSLLDEVAPPRHKPDETLSRACWSMSTALSTPPPSNAIASSITAPTRAQHRDLARCFSVTAISRRSFVASARLIEAGMMLASHLLADLLALRRAPGLRTR